jgi:Ca2+-binding RTX toxin-like protein
MFESLESRRLLAASLSNGVLTVTGTWRDDLIRIVQKQTTVNVTINGQLSKFTIPKVKSVIVAGNRGDDRILIDLGQHVFLGDVTEGATIDTSIKALTADGGGGNDTIDSSGGSVDLLRGGDGNDYLRSVTIRGNQLKGEGGDDTLIGGISGDDLSGGDGNDTVDCSDRGSFFGHIISLDDVANDGHFGVNFDTAARLQYGDNDVIDIASEHDNVHSDIETVVSGDGNDKITGSGFDNRIVGGGGDDTLIGGGGDDTLIGGAGLDLLSGGSGRDKLDGGTDADQIFGGAGTDLAINPDLHDAFHSDDVENAMSRGTVDRYNPTGGPTFGEGNTGWVIRLPELFTDIDPTGHIGPTKALLGQIATALGKLNIRNFVERGPTPVIAVQTIKAS